MKKILGAMSLFLVALTVFWGCGKASGGGVGENEDVTIRMSWWGNDDRHKATLEAIKAFEEKNPTIKVKAEYSGWDGIIEKMITQIAGGTEPDVMQINYDWYKTYSPEGTGFYDLNELSDIIDLSGYEESVLEAGTIDGKLNGIPHGENATAIVINKTIFDKFGAEIPTTWDGYIEAAKKFDEGYYPFTSSGINLWVIYLTQKTGEALLDDDGNINYTVEEIQEGLEWYQNLVDNKVLPDRKTRIETIGNQHPSTVKEFIDGNFAGAMDWSGGIASYATVLSESDQEAVIPVMPTIENPENDGAILKPTMLFSISKNSEHPEESAKLLDFLLNDPEGVKLMGTTRGVPVNKNAVEILTEDGQVEGIAADANQYTHEVTGVTESPYFEMNNVVESYNSVFEQFELGILNSKEAAEEMINKIESTIENVKSQN